MHLPPLFSSCTGLVWYKPEKHIISSSSCSTSLNDSKLVEIQFDYLTKTQGSADIHHYAKISKCKYSVNAFHDESAPPLLGCGYIHRYYGRMRKNSILTQKALADLLGLRWREYLMPKARSSGG